MLAIGLLGAGILFFALFGRRRRGEPSVGDPALVSASEPSPGWAPPAAAPDGEEHIPRWLRASVRDARFSTPSRERAAAPPKRRHALTFDEPAAEAAARLVVRYDHVEVYDQPNEAYARILAEVGTGDEVEIVELTDAWALVRTPHGVSGWLPTMTVGAPQAAFAPPEPLEDAAARIEVRPAAARRIATEPREPGKPRKRSSRPRGAPEAGT